MASAAGPTLLEAPAAPMASTHADPAGPAGEPQGFDRALVMSLARIPAIALVWLAAAWAAGEAVREFGWFVVPNGRVADLGPVAVNLGPLAVIAFGMLLAAVIDGYAFKVPNWCTLSLVVAGWYIGLLHSLGYTELVPGLAPEAGRIGGIGAALAGTAIGFLLLFPALFIGGMGEGDVKMTMGFGSWLGAYFGLGLGLKTLVYAFAAGAIIGGVFGVVIIILRRRYRASWQNTKAIGRDLKVMATDGHDAGVKRATERRKEWIRLPYGVPLCAGFLGYLAYMFY